MKRQNKPHPGTATAGGKRGPLADSRSQSAVNAKTDRDPKETTTAAHSLDPPRKRAADEATPSTGTVAMPSSVGPATEDLAPGTSSYRTISAGKRGIVDNAPSGADTEQLPTAVPTAAETRLLTTRSKTNAFGGEAEMAPPPSGRSRSPRSKKKRRHRGSVKSSTSSDREPTESATTEVSLKSQRHSSADATTSGVSSSPETAVIHDFESVIYDLAAKVIALYDATDTAAEVAIGTVASTTCHGKSSSELAPADTAALADNTSPDALKGNDDATLVVTSSSRDHQIVHSSAQAGAGAVIEEYATALQDQKKVDAVSPVHAVQEGPCLDRKGKDDAGDQCMLPPTAEPVQQGPATSASASAPAPLRQHYQQGQPAPRAPRPRIQGAQKKERESSRLLSKGSEDPVVSSHDARRSAIGSPSQWSFYRELQNNWFVE
ncbi:hypothetical protein HPB50_015973 [Hyalomma asiaticum]|uniref:Uncharacterized protein n=1 Tax=Hyalomma asiaticum TaxID=266040 RepID=A0ACB7RQ70_HYAAI|nr:hypothetical protein HPB50_015973 [Hyalomma asiaticum]